MMVNRRWIVIALLMAAGALFLLLAVSAERAVARHYRQAALNADLLDAVKSRDTRWALLLIESGADIEVKNHADFDSPNWREDDLTPLALAIVKDDSAMVKMLMAHGANVNAKTEADGKGYPPHDIVLANVAKTGDVDIAVLLFAKGAKADVRGAGNETPLMMAAGSKHPQMVTFLLQKGADVNARDDRGFTPLHMISGTPRRESEESRRDRIAVIRILKNASGRL